MCALFVPISQKLTLTIKEAAEYSNIGINRINSLLRALNRPVVLLVGKKKLVKWRAFEEFIRKKLMI
ncbi:MAG: DNA-binding protein [Oscillospiraceae bacterium]|nr:DNA-binding protein [Oscillospiraceae bacterium]